jgi:transcriptional regulator with XRE-family HTH domain
MNSVIGNRIREIRKALRLNQTEMARRISVHLQTLSKYERGKQIPSYETLVTIADKLMVNPVWLLSGLGEMFGSATKGPHEVSVGPIFKRIIEAAGWRDYEPLAKELSVDSETVHRLILANDLPLKDIIDICIKYRLDISWVLSGVTGRDETSGSSTKSFDPLVTRIVDMLIEMPEDDLEDILRLMQKEITYKELLRQQEKETGKNEGRKPGQKKNHKR